MWAKLSDDERETPAMLASVAAFAGKFARSRMLGMWTDIRCYAARHHTGGLLTTAMVQNRFSDLDPDAPAMFVAFVAGGMLGAERDGYRILDHDPYPDGRKEADAERKRVKRAAERAAREAAEAAALANERGFVRIGALLVPGHLADASADCPPDVRGQSGAASADRPVGRPADNATDKPEVSSRAGARIPALPVPSEDRRAGEQRNAPRRAPRALGETILPPAYRTGRLVREVRSHLLRVVHLAIESGAPYVDADGKPVDSAIWEQLKTSADRHLGVDLRLRGQIDALMAVQQAALARHDRLTQALAADSRGKTRWMRAFLKTESGRRWKREREAQSR